MKTTNKTTPTKQEDTPTGTKTATPNAHPPSDSSKITRATPPAKRRLTEVSKPVFEIIACFANCAGFPRNVVKPFDEIYSYERIEYIFDLRDNRTGLVYKGLFASLGGEWDLPFLTNTNQGTLPLLSALKVKWPLSAEDYADLADYEDIIVAELNRWSRNLFALVEYEHKRDEGFDEYVAVMTEMTEEEQEYLKRQGNEQTDSSCLKFHTFPLRP
jgi:hypothetical protein